MDTIKIIQIFNKVITSKELDRKIIYKFLNHILSKHNIILVEGDIYIKEIRSHIVDNTINNNYLIRVNKNNKLITPILIIVAGENLNIAIKLSSYK